MKTFILWVALCLPAATSLVTRSLQSHNAPNTIQRAVSHLCMSSTEDESLLDRRSVLWLAGKVVPAALLVASSASSFPGLAYADGDSKKIVVLGGAGYVGSRVVQLLSDKGYEVVAVSRSSPSEQAEKVKSNLGKALPKIQFLSLDAGKDDLSDVLKGAPVVVSCVGIPPWGENKRAGNGAVNMRIVEAAKAAGVERFVYVSVASEFANGPAKFLFGDYIKGKTEAEAAVVKTFGSSAFVVKPGLIDGAPPGEIRPPGPPGVAAVSVDAVAKAVVAGALGKKTGSADGYDAVMDVASLI